MKRTTFALLATTPLLAQAHVGAHAHDGFSLAEALSHLFSDPAHIALLLIVGVIGGMLYRRQRANRKA